jgi:hypothetical protein
VPLESQSLDLIVQLDENQSPDLSGLPQVLADLRLHQRKAFELCAVVLGAFRRYEANPFEDALKDGLETARRIAETELRTQKNDVPIARFLADALEKVVRTAMESSESFPLSISGKQAIIHLTNVQLSLQKGADLACDITTIFQECYAAAKKFYSDYLTQPYHLPGISLSIVGTDCPNEAFPGRTIAFNGSAFFEEKEDADPKRTAVKLTVHPLLNSGCLPALPYILMHEILCHWPQMSRQSGARPNPEKLDNALDKDALYFDLDPFSEGWMDSLVAESLRYHFGDADTLRGEEIRTATDIHDERTIYNRVPAYKDAGRIEPGAKAAAQVRWFYSVEMEPSTLDPDFRSLSCELNTASWNYEQRLKGCSALIRACRAFKQRREGGVELKERDLNILNALRDFRKNRNITPLLNLIL